MKDEEERGEGGSQTVSVTLRYKACCKGVRVSHKLVLLHPRARIERAFSKSCMARNAILK